MQTQNRKVVNTLLLQGEYKDLYFQQQDQLRDINFCEFNKQNPLLPFMLFFKGEYCVATGYLPYYFEQFNSGNNLEEVQKQLKVITSWLDLREDQGKYIFQEIQIRLLLKRQKEQIIMNRKSGFELYIEQLQSLKKEVDDAFQETIKENNFDILEVNRQFELKYGFKPFLDYEQKQYNFEQLIQTEDGPVLKQFQKVQQEMCDPFLNNVTIDSNNSKSKHICKINIINSKSKQKNEQLCQKILQDVQRTQSQNYSSQLSEQQHVSNQNNMPILQTQDGQEHLSQLEQAKFYLEQYNKIIQTMSNTCNANSIQELKIQTNISNEQIQQKLDQHPFQSPIKTSQQENDQKDQQQQSQKVHEDLQQSFSSSNNNKEKPLVQHVQQFNHQSEQLQEEIICDTNNQNQLIQQDQQLQETLNQSQENIIIQNVCSQENPLENRSQFNNQQIQSNQPQQINQQQSEIIENNYLDQNHCGAQIASIICENNGQQELQLNIIQNELNNQEVLAEIIQASQQQSQSKQKEQAISRKPTQENQDDDMIYISDQESQNDKLDEAFFIIETPQQQQINKQVPKSCEHIIPLTLQPNQEQEADNIQKKFVVNQQIDYIIEKLDDETCQQKNIHIKTLKDILDKVKSTQNNQLQTHLLSFSPAIFQTLVQNNQLDIFHQLQTRMKNIKV